MSLRLLHPLKREESQASRVPAAAAGEFWLKPAVSGREDTPVGADGPGLPCARCARLRLPRGSSVSRDGQLQPRAGTLPPSPVFTASWGSGATERHTFPSQGPMSCESFGRAAAGLCCPS